MGGLHHGGDGCQYGVKAIASGSCLDLGGVGGSEL